MNYIHFLPNKNNFSTLIFCIVDDLHNCHNLWSAEIVKNIADYNISNISNKGYEIIQGYDEDNLLQTAYQKKFSHAVVVSAATFFLNGDDFFNNVQELIKEDFFFAGHILDRKSAYYELHSQCYVVNLQKYSDLGFPQIGQQTLGTYHSQIQPLRSTENYHDDYTPLWVNKGRNKLLYEHKCHGWNIISESFKNNLTIRIFDDSIRNSKKYLYPESRATFLQSLSWLYDREHKALSEFVHTSNTELKSDGLNSVYKQIIIPASGTLYTDLITEGKIVFYDYNEKALNYWKNKIVKKESINYDFVKLDLLSGSDLADVIDPSLQENTLINLSNIFCYEGTISFSPLYYRLEKELELIERIKKKAPAAHINFTSRAASGMIENLKTQGKAQDFETIKINQLKKPTWHHNRDWY